MKFKKGKSIDAADSFWSAVSKDTVASEAFTYAKQLADEEAQQRVEEALAEGNLRAATSTVALVGIAVPVGDNRYDVAGTIVESSEDLTGMVFTITGEYSPGNRTLRNLCRTPLVGEDDEPVRVGEAVVKAALRAATNREERRQQGRQRYQGGQAQAQQGQAPAPAAPGAPGATANPFM